MHFISFVVFLVVTPTMSALALFKGDRGERYGALIFVVPTALETVLFEIVRGLGYSTVGITPFVDLVSTFAISAGFLYLAIRFASLWLAAAMVVQGSDLYFARAFIDADTPNYHLYGTEINVITITVALLLGGAAIWSWRARIQKWTTETKRAALLIEREQARDQRFRAMLEGPLAAALPAAKVSRDGMARLIIEPPPI
jgi:hypothetical protein